MQSKNLEGLYHQRIDPRISPPPKTEIQPRVDSLLFIEHKPQSESEAVFELIQPEFLDVVVHIAEAGECNGADSPVNGESVLVINDLNSQDSTGIYITTENDGSYTLTSDDLAPLDPMTYQLHIVLVKQDMHNILALGYDPRSWIWARILSTQIVMMAP